ncbi:MAG: glucose 1-dehydrogenase [Deltaproteobacteria bacterium]|nr:glucose 1-dehydrogenase [Deltaproteobacteria bacterium]
MHRLEKKTAIITGGSRGIGRASAILLTKEGAKVAITDMIDEEGQELERIILQSGGTAKYWHMDVAKEKEVASVFSEIAKTFGKIDVLVNNAGIAGANKPTHEISEEEWDQVMNINVKGVFFCTKHVIPYLKQSGAGSIINLSSIYGLISAPDVPPYHASKGAVRLMTKTDALLYAKDKIRVNSIHPGYIWTPLVENLLKSQGDVETGRKKLDGLHPLGHIGEPDDIAYAVLFLASDESKFMTGAEVVIDGGYTVQ